MVFLDSTIESQKRAIEVYLSDFSRPFLRSLPIVGRSDIRALRVPVGFFSDEEMRLAGSGVPEGVRELELLSSLDLDPLDPEEQEDLSFGEMRKSLDLLRKADERSVNRLLNRDIHSFPPLDSLQYKVVFVEKGKVGFLKERVLSLALQSLLSFVDGKDLEGDSLDDRFISILRDFLECHDLLDLSPDCFTSEEELLNLPSLEDDDEQANTERYEQLLPDLEPRYVPFRGPTEDLVFLVRGSIGE
jgi:hypothetical protein